MARSKDTVAARYDKVRDRVVSGEKIEDAIKAELPDSDIAFSTLRAAYLGLAREKGHTRGRKAKSTLDIEAFKARFDAAVAEREARQRPDFAVLTEQLGDHLREATSKHPPTWVRATIVACGVAVTKEEFASWLGDVIGAASRRQKSSRSSRVLEGGSALPSVGQGAPKPDVERSIQVSAPGSAPSEPQRGDAKPALDANGSEQHRTASSPKPPRPKVLGTQGR